MLIYWGGKKSVVLFREAKEYGKSVLAKKAITANSKAEKKSQKNVEDPETPELKEYTFFETLGDPEMKKIVGLNNEIQDQPPPQSIHIAEKKVPPAQQSATRNTNTPHSDTLVAESTSIQPPEENKSPKKIVKEVEKKLPVTYATNVTSMKTAVKTPVAGEKNADDDKTYTVQVNSFKDLTRAQNLQNQLQKRGGVVPRFSWQVYRSEQRQSGGQ